MPPPRPRIRPPLSPPPTTSSTPIQTAITLLPPTNTHLRISLHVKPNAAKERIVAIHPDQISISIPEAARDGEANAGVVGFISEVLGARKSDTEIVSGFKSRDKVVRVEVEGLKWFGSRKGKKGKDGKEVDKDKSVVEMVLERFRERLEGEGE